MSFRDVRGWLEDALESIEYIEEFSAGQSQQQYESNRLVQAAVERQLQIIAEVAYRLGPDGAELMPEINWRGLRNLGNVLRHEYHKIDDGLIWRRVQDDLPVLKAALERALTKLPPS